MKKILKVFLICFLSLSFFGCSSKAKTAEEVGTILKEKGFEVTKTTNLKGNTLTDMVTISTKTNMIVGVFNEKKISYIYYSIDNDIYVMPEEDITKPTSTKDLDKEYTSLLKDMDLTKEDIKTYCLNQINNVRSGFDIEKVIEKCDFNGQFKDDKLSYDDNMYLASSDKRFFLNAYFRDNKLGKLVFASSLYSTADKLFVYENGKMTKDDGWISYIGFLDQYKITHEEFINYLTAKYEANK